MWPLVYCFYTCLVALVVSRPIRAENIQLDLTTLNGYQWQVSLPNGSWGVPGHVPGGIYSDLERSGDLNEGPLLYRFNDVNYRWIALQDWTYQLNFQVNGTITDQPGLFLIFHGLDTSADIRLNGIPLLLGSRIDNMFVRYRFNVRNLLKDGDNHLQVNLQSAVQYARDEYHKHLIDYAVPPNCVPPEYQGECHANFIRKMQASFGWDWGPAFPSVGLWKTVTVEAYQTVMYRDVYVETSRVAPTGEWLLLMLVHCETVDVGVQHKGSWTIQLNDAQGVELMTETVNDAIIVGDEEREASLEFRLKVPDVHKIEPWMPRGYGNQTLYSLSISYSSLNGGEKAFTTQVQIGFRTVALIEDDLESGGRTFYVTVNEEPIFLKGSNWIPADILPELVTTDYIRALLTACIDANMNSLRVWGGGIYEMDEFYQIADELGILVWQDFMFACSMYPTGSEFLESVSTEIRQQVRRLQHHPSLLLWAGNNENEAALRGNWYGTSGDFDTYRRDYIKLYVETVREIVRQEDPSRPFVVSSPSNGKESEEEGHVAKNPYSSLYGDVHYYNYYANGWNTSTLPKPRMSTEYGYQSLPSIHTWATGADPLDQDDWSYDGELLSHRQHHPLGNFEMRLQVTSRLGPPRKTSSRREFLDMIYLTQMHQAQALKTQTEHYRRHRYQLTETGEGLTMAALYWQLNDIWQAPSWASIEYGSLRWKPLHYFAAQFFAPLLFILAELPDGSVAAFAHFDRRQDLINGTLMIYVRSWDRLEPLVTLQVPILSDLEPNKPVWVQPLEEFLNRIGCTRGTCLMTTSFVDSFGLVKSPDNHLFLTSFPFVTNLQKANIKIQSVSQVFSTEKSPWSVNVTLVTDAIAAFVWLDSQSGRQGTFSANGFLLCDNSKTVTFYSKDEIQDLAQFQADLTVTHLAQILL